MKALSIRKNKCEDQVRPAFGSSYAANMTSAAIDHEVQRLLESVRHSSVEQEIKRRVQHEMQMASFYAAMPFHSHPNDRGCTGEISKKKMSSKPFFSHCNLLEIVCRMNIHQDRF